MASNVDANVTFLNLMDARELPGEFVAAIRKIDYTSPSLKINVALSELVSRWTMSRHNTNSSR
mgnify:CR=1 FL=1